MEYLALIGDVRRSRSKTERGPLQRRLRATLDELNDAYLGDGLVARLTLRRGDEVQGLLDRPPIVVDLLRAVAEALHPTELRWGMGWGGITTDLSEDPELVDGPAFHLARGALDEAAQQKTWAVCRGLGSGDAVVNGYWALLHAVRSRWSPTQLRYVTAARGAQHQKEVAHRYAVTEAAVSKSLSAARFSAVLSGEAGLRAALSMLTING